MRVEMARDHKEVTHPHLFGCPFVEAGLTPDAVRSSYSFAEVRRRFGSQLKEKFWPVFQVRSP